MVKEEVVEDMDLAREIMSDEDYSFVVIKNSEILVKETDFGVKTLIKNKDKLTGCVIGQKILSKASSLICSHLKVEGVFSNKATKTAIAVLIIAGIPSQVDELIPSVTTEDESNFEKMVENINSPEKAYNLLKENI